MQNLKHDCADVTVLMSLALDDMLSSQEKAELETQLRTCSTCQFTWATWQRIDARLHTAPMVQPAPNFAARVDERIERWEQTQRWKMFVGAGMMWVASAFWMLLIAGAVVGLAFLAARESGFAGWMVASLLSLIQNADVIGRGLLVLWNALTQVPWYPFVFSYALIMLGLTVLWLQLVRRYPATFGSHEVSTHGNASH